MNNYLKNIGTTIIGILIGILLSGIVFIVFYYTKICRKREVTTGEFINSTLGFFITFLLFDLSQKTDNKKSIKGILVNDLSLIEEILNSLDDLVQNKIGENPSDQNIDLYKLVLQSKLKHIANKISFININGGTKIEDKKLQETNDKFRDIVTATIGNNGFIIDNSYFRLFTNGCNDFIGELNKCKQIILDQ